MCSVLLYYFQGFLCMEKELAFIQSDTEASSYTHEEHRVILL